MQTIFPILRYQDARQAIAWLCSAFGFEVVFCEPETGPTVRHARLRLAENIIMLGSVREEETGFESPITAQVITQAICVYIQGVERHYQRSCDANVSIERPLEHTGFGASQYEARDIEGHLWIFTTPADIGTG